MWKNFEVMSHGDALSLSHSGKCMKREREGEGEKERSEGGNIRFMPSRYTSHLLSPFVFL
jgi:hypothetical protein